MHSRTFAERHRGSRPAGNLRSSWQETSPELLARLGRALKGRLPVSRPLHKGCASLLLAVVVMTVATLAQKKDAPKSDITVTLLGSGGGPNPNPKRFGPSILVQAGTQTLLFDCGRGASIRLAQVGMLLGQVDKVFLTHLHSDHVIGLPDLYLTGWGAQGRKTPFRVWGPSGTKEMMEHLQKAFDFDIRVRRDIDEKFAKEGIEVSSTEIKEGVVFQEEG